MPTLPNRLKDIDLDIKKFPMPDATDIQKADIAALTCKTNKDFMEFLGIEEITFKIWYRKSVAFKNAIDAWKDHTTKEVERALAKKAVGFTKITKREVITKAGELITLKNETYYPPDTAAAQFWLKNRAPKDWKDTSQVDVNVNANIRAWLVSAMGEGDDSELLDVSPGSVLALEPTETVDSLIEGSAIAVEGESEPLEGPIADTGGVASGQTPIAWTDAARDPVQASAQPAFAAKSGDLFG